MPSYPAIPQELATKKKTVPGKRTDIAEDGSVRGQLFFTAGTYRFEVRHMHITAAEKDEILAFWESNKTGEFTFTRGADSVVYDCIFEDEPDDDHLGGNLWGVTSRLVGRKA